MVFDITQLKKVRKQLELTQTEFARRAGISQSMIAKIEAGKLDPTYTYVKKIEDALQLLTKREEKEARDIMHRGITSVRRNDTVAHVIKLFSTYKISQMPVIENIQVIGLVTESSLLEHAEEKMFTQRVEDVMVDSPPIITSTTKLSVITPLLKFYPVVLIQDKGRLEGIISKADILTHL